MLAAAEPNARLLRELAASGKPFCHELLDELRPAATNTTSDRLWFTPASCPNAPTKNSTGSPPG